MIDFDIIKMGERIREARIECGLSQRVLAEKIGMAQNTIAQYEAGTAKPRLDVLFKLAQALNATTDYLLGLED